MNVLVVLAVILFLLMRGVGGVKGTKSFLSLFLNLLLLFWAVLFMAKGFSPVWITLISCVAISAVNLFYINSWSKKTVVAFLSTLATLLVISIVIYLVVTKTLIQGLGEEEVVEMDMYSFFVGIDFVRISICTMIMGTVGAVNDTALSISSSMTEVLEQNPTLTVKEWFLSGMKIGRDILGTTTNTLLFAFIGGSLALVIWLKDLNYSLEMMLNAKVVAAEIISMLISGIGVTMIIPITAFLMTKYQFKITKY